MHEQRGKPKPRQATRKRLPLEVLGNGLVRLDRRLHTNPSRRSGRDVRLCEELRPDQRKTLDELGLGHLAGAPALLHFRHPRSLPVRQSAAQVGVLLAEEGGISPERVDQKQAEQPVGVRDAEMKREVTAPGVPDRPRTVEAERVQHGHRVAHVRLHRVGSGRRVR